MPTSKKLRDAYTKRSSRRELMPCINNFIKFNRITLLNRRKQSALMENYFDIYTFEKKSSNFFESHAFLFIPCKPNPKRFFISAAIPIISPYQITIMPAYPCPQISSLHQFPADDFNQNGRTLLIATPIQEIILRLALIAGIVSRGFIIRFLACTFFLTITQVVSIVGGVVLISFHFMVVLVSFLVVKHG